jgi:hypothetical protein
METLSIHVLTAMKAYESKSQEELRLEDYRRGNKTGGNAPATGRSNER